MLDDIDGLKKRYANDVIFHNLTQSFYQLIVNERVSADDLVQAVRMAVYLRTVNVFREAIAQNHIVPFRPDQPAGDATRSQ